MDEWTKKIRESKDNMLQTNTQTASFQPYNSSLFDLSRREEVSPKELARYLYEREGASLIDISKELSLNYSTLKTWRSREDWNACKESQLAGRNPNSLRNLEEGSQKHPNFEEGNKEAVTHGFYADNTKDPIYSFFFEQALHVDIYKPMKLAFAQFYAHLCTWEYRHDSSMDLHTMELDAKENLRLVNMLLKSVKLKGYELERKLGLLEMLTSEWNAANPEEPKDSTRK